MELSLMERQLLAGFRQLSQEHQHQLLQQLESLRLKPDNNGNQSVPSVNQCPLKTQLENRQEDDSASIITE